MDKLFLYEPDEMIKKIKVIEPEMREDSYGEITEGLDTTSRNALAYISEIFSYMKKNWNIDQCTVLALMKELSAKYPIYYADGNHELKLARNEEIFGVRYKDYVHSLKEYNIHHISNETIVIQSETGFISLTAFDLEKKYYQRFHVPRMPLSHMESVVGSSPGNIFHILLAHNPNYLKTYADWGSDLVLAGHFHGGMVRIPKFGGVISPQFQIFPKYDAGEFHEGETTMILSRGLGNHSIKLRLFNKPEISCIELKKRD